ncbi:histidine kinase [Streptomyces sp. NBC_01762]|uniref:sensor histidine kinase n=1 Tax=unclassified Streptomyces TaxID=2593676 RepID=UPI002DDB0316|nr:MULTISPECIES: histidine kinase [unclassified Streptomyces]WSC41060.1 histidine kinase [Streptomyces sp. NBC_01763]WSC49158.1 histidine kinase [Streptomyces sp. NBC_01762]WSJ49175.1 histidine kinase [Streptomyces sp. NBC_01318]
MRAQERSHWSPRRVDALVTVAVIALGVVDSWVKPSSGLLTGLPTPVIAAVSGAVGATLWWRRSRPDLVAAVVIVAYVVTFTPVALAVAMYTIGTVHRRPRILAAYTVAGAAAGIAGLRGGLPDAGVREAAYSLALILGPLAVGYVVAVRRDLTAATQARVADLEREHLVLDERARAEERAAIAREMHDVVGHRVSNMVLAAGALQVGPAAGHPDVVRTAELIRSDGRQALEELREILGVLSVGHPVHWAPTAPQPDVAQLPGIVAHATERGQSVQLQVNGHPETLSAPVQRAVHRIVQESLTNAAKHAPGAQVRIDVDCRSDGVHVSVGNGASTGHPSADLPSGGHGLVGLAERVELLGGTLTAGPHGDGFLVSAFIPHRRGVS